MIYAVMLALIALVQFDPVKALANTSSEQESLQGLPGVFVIFEEIPEDAVDDGLSQEAAKTALERVLQASGISILSVDQYLDSRSNPMLHIAISTLKQNSAYVYVVKLELVQGVVLVSNSEKEMGATTWSEVSYGIIGKLKVGDVIHVLERLTKKFANDFLTVNQH